MGGEDRDRLETGETWNMKHRSNLHLGDDRHFCFCISSDNFQLFACWSVDWYLMASIKEDCILEVRLMSRKIVIHHQLLPRKKFQWLTHFQVASNCNIPSLAYLLLNSRKDHSSVFFSVTTSLLCYLFIGSFALVQKCHKKSCLCFFAISLQSRLERKLYHLSFWGQKLRRKHMNIITQPGKIILTFLTNLTSASMYYWWFLKQLRIIFVPLC